MLNTARRRSPSPAPAPDAAHRRLRGIRARMDALDTALVALLNERTGLAVRVSRLKRAAGLPLRTPAREEVVLDQVRRATAGPLPPASVERIFRAILTESRASQRRAVKARQS